jgi:hypothetical protein
MGGLPLRGLLSNDCQDSRGAPCDGARDRGGSGGLGGFALSVKPLTSRRDCR